MREHDSNSRLLILLKVTY